ncbi:MAG: PDZ domain-containing protein [Candidatus Brocadiales bacterium]
MIKLLQSTERIILTLLILPLVCIYLYSLPAYAQTLFSGLEVAGSKMTPGARVAGVAPGSPASRAGIQPGDVIVSIEGQDVKSLENFVNISRTIKGKGKAAISLNRQGKLYNVVLDKNPAKQKQAQLETGGLGAGIGLVQRGSLGVLIRGGALVVDVMTGSAAEKAGIKRGDSIVEFNGREISTAADLPQVVAALAPGTRVEVKIVREGRMKNMQVILGKREKMPEAAPYHQDRQEPAVSKEKKEQPPGDIDIPDNLGEL